ncbi:GNAT family N-acetyltransferase [Kitasatospora sp. NPDC056327]|uniref:GNAT family N-acetyltransferase n=1 Tax=Kitasatospora sp. NPDC056327 TaxID=3345785 RepID=UPI0035E2D43B
MTVDWNRDGVAFRRAAGEHTHEVLGVLDEAAAWLGGKGVRQWPARFGAHWVEGAIARGETWLVDVDGEPVGTFTLDWADPMWAELGGTAGYVHRLAVRRRVPGLGAVILDRARETARERGVDALRLDCVRHNERLRAYYEGRGFVHRGDVPVDGPPGERPQDARPQVWLSRYELALPPGA